MRISLALLAVAALTAASASAATIVQNGDFETVDGRLGVTTGGSDGNPLNSLAGGSGNGTWDVYASLPGGWSSSLGAGIEVQTTRSVGLTPKSGAHYVELDSENEGHIGSNSNMFQNLGLLDSGKYQLSFWYRPRTATASDNGIRVDVTGGAAFTTAVAGGDRSAWMLYEFLFQVVNPAAPTILSFTATGDANEHGGFLDDISVAAVPLPAPALLLLGALGGLGLMGRRAVRAGSKAARA